MLFYEVKCGYEGSKRLSREEGKAEAEEATTLQGCDSSSNTFKIASEKEVDRGLTEKQNRTNRLTRIGLNSL